MNKKKKTVGAHARELLMQKPDEVDPIELQREMQKDYAENVSLAIEEGKKTFQHPFYVVVLTKREKLMTNVIRDYFFSRITCPTPDYDQAVFKIDPATDTVTFLWVIPSYDAVEYLYDNAIEARADTPMLVEYVCDFKNGSLLKRAKELNNETPDQGVLILN